MPTITTINSNMDYSRVLKVSRMYLRPSNEPILDIKARKLTAPLNSPRVVLSQANPDMQPPGRDKTVATPLQTRPLNPSLELYRVHNLNLAINSNHKLATTPTATPTTPAPIMLRTSTSTNNTVQEAIQEDRMVPKEVSTSNTRATECLQELHMIMPRLPLQVVSVDHRCTVEIVLWAGCLSMVVLDQLRLHKLPKPLAEAVPSVLMKLSAVALHIKANLSNTLAASKEVSKVSVMI